MPVPAQPYTLGQLVTRARALADAGPRQLLGIAGAPGAGKSTLAAEVVAALGPVAALVPMDGFHLAEAELHRLGRHARKGAIDTFDGAGFVALMERLRSTVESTVYAPEFRRELEESIAGAIAVPPRVRLVVTEGNYLLVPAHPWGELRALLDEVWFLDLDAEERQTPAHRPAHRLRSGGSRGGGPGPGHRPGQRGPDRNHRAPLRCGRTTDALTSRRTGRESLPAGAIAKRIEDW